MGLIQIAKNKMIYQEYTSDTITEDRYHQIFGRDIDKSLSGETLVCGLAEPFSAPYVVWPRSMAKSFRFDVPKRWIVYGLMRIEYVPIKKNDVRKIGVESLNRPDLEEKITVHLKKIEDLPIIFW